MSSRPPVAMRMRSIASCARTLTGWVGSCPVARRYRSSAEALGTIARSGTKAFMDRIEAAQGARAPSSSASSGSASTRPSWWRTGSMSSRAGPAVTKPALWSSDGKGSYTVAPSRHRRGARARHAGHPAPEGGCRLLHRALHAGAHRQGAVRPRAGARSCWSRSPERSRRRSPMARRSGSSRGPRSSLRSTPTSTAAWPASSTSPR